MCELKDNSNGIGIIELPMLVTESHINNQIIGYNALEELVGEYDNSLGTDEITLLLENSFPQKIVGNVNVIINCIQMESDAYLSAVKTLKREITIPAQEAKKLSFCINLGNLDKDIPVIFENDVFHKLLNGIEIDKTLIYVKRGIILRNLVKGGLARKLTKLQQELRDEHEDQSFDMAYKLTNSDIFKITGAKPLQQFIEEQQLNWYAHIVCQPNNNYTKQLTFALPPKTGGRRGQPLCTLKRVILNNYEKSEADINRACFLKNQTQLLQFKKYHEHN
eukprot:gene4472-5066_t